jgi:hypothetical protein
VIAALALRIRAECPTNIRPFVPTDAEPVEVIEHRIGEIRFGALRIQILIAQNQGSGGIARSDVRDPEGARVAEVQQAGWRGRDASAIPGRRFAHADSLSAWGKVRSPGQTSNLRQTPFQFAGFDSRAEQPGTMRNEMGLSFSQYGSAG